MTVISNVNHEMNILKEVFGPVSPIVIVENEAEAIIWEANNSEFWTRC